MKGIARTLLISCLLYGAATSEASSEGLAEKQYQKAVELREKKNASSKQLAQAASLLKAAAGVQIVAPNSPPAANELMPGLSYLEVDPGVFVSEQTHPAALMLLSEIYFHDDQGLPFNPSVAFSLLIYAASLGFPAAQREFGLALAIGLRPPAKSSSRQTAFDFGAPEWGEGLLHLFSAASNGDLYAKMALGYRHLEGLGVPKNCSAAALYYAPVAASVVKTAQKPGGLPKVDLVPLNSEGPRWPRLNADHERLHYQWFADMGYVDAQRMVGRLLSLGGEENAQEALKYFQKAADANDGEAKAFLGHFYANGIGVEADNDTAIELFRKGAKLGSASANFGLGFMYLHGYGLPKDFSRASQFLVKAMEKGHAEATFHLGTMHMNGWGVPQSVPQAQNYFALAANLGHPAAQYNLAMTLLEKKDTCSMGVQRLKSVAERGPWTDMLKQAANHFEKGRQDLALMLYLKLGEAGFEVAQVNAAWMLGNNYGLPPAVDANEFNATDNTAAHAAKAGIRSNQRASQQGNVPAMLSVGDTYYYGRGVLRDYQKAFQLYSSAASFGRSAQALYNVGYMYEYGLGTTTDFALAKRNFDKAAESHAHAYAPAKLALLRLRAHQRWISSAPAVLQDLAAFVSGHELLHPPGSFLPKLTIDLSSILHPLSINFGVLAELGLGLVRKLDYEAWEAYMISALGAGLLAVLLRRRQLLRRPWQDDLRNPQAQNAQMQNAQVHNAHAQNVQAQNVQAQNVQAQNAQVPDAQRNAAGLPAQQVQTHIAQPQGLQPHQEPGSGVLPVSSDREASPPNATQSSTADLGASSSGTEMPSTVEDRRGSEAQASPDGLSRAGQTHDASLREPERPHEPEHG